MLKARLVHLTRRGGYLKSSLPFLESLSSSVPRGGYPKLPHRSFGDEKAVKQRIKSVESIGKITKAMKMVASSKIRQDCLRRDAMHNFVPPFLQHNFNRILKSSDDITPTDEDTVCFSIYSDEGLCGAVNVYVTQRTEMVFQKHKSTTSSSFNLCHLGQRAPEFSLDLRHSLQRSFTEACKPRPFSLACVIAHRLIQTGFPKILLVYNRFRNLISYETLVLELAPLDRWIKVLTQQGHNIEPDERNTVSNLYEFFVATSVYQAILENAASEQSSRITAMDNASKNAKDMLSDLKQKYNSARQIKTTMELIEIIAGADAL